MEEDQERKTNKNKEEKKSRFPNGCGTSVVKSRHDWNMTIYGTREIYPALFAYSIKEKKKRKAKMRGAFWVTCGLVYASVLNLNCKTPESIEERTIVLDNKHGRRDQGTTIFLSFCFSVFIFTARATRDQLDRACASLRGYETVVESYRTTELVVRSLRGRKTSCWSKIVLRRIAWKQPSSIHSIRHAKWNRRLEQHHLKIRSNEPAE